MLLRPYAAVIRGRLQWGLEFRLDDTGMIVEVGPHTGMPEPYVLTPAFVNAHSHLEYRTLMGQIPGGDYWIWIRQLTELKKSQTEAEVVASCELGAAENRATGVHFIAEHSDRPFAGVSLSRAGFEGPVFQELITFLEQASPEEKRQIVLDRAATQGAAVSPHAYHTVDESSLRWVLAQGGPLSIHVAETQAENDFTERGEGPLAAFYESFGFSRPPTGKSVARSLLDLGFAGKRVQFVHGCALSETDISVIARADVSLAHCPRSNISLGCPAARVRRWLDAGIRVGLGLDSAASSGPIDMFDEMRAALDLSRAIGEPITAEEVWWMATGGGYAAIPSLPKVPYDLVPGAKMPLLRLSVEGAHETEDLLGLDHLAVSWIDGGDGV